MKELDMITMQDITDVPSDDLKKKTLAAMAKVEARQARAKKPIQKRILVFAAMFCAALMLMSMGYKVYDYLTYVPGMGILTAEQADVYALYEVVDADGYKIEAASMIPSVYEEYEGYHEITVLTDMEVTKAMYDEPSLLPPMTLYVGDEAIPLRFSGGSGIGARYEGFAQIRGAGDYDVSWNGETYTLTMETMENSVWANYAYPISEGITVVAFPLSRGSQYIVYDVIVEPTIENMRYWASHSTTLSSMLNGMTVTDVDGNTYQSTGANGRSAWIPASEKNVGLNSLLRYRIEKIARLDAPLATDIATIDIASVTLTFREIEGAGGYTVTIPALGERIDAEDLTDNGRIFDGYGVTQDIDGLYTEIDEINNTYALRIPAIERGTTIDFEENVVSYRVELGGRSAASDHIHAGGAYLHTEDGGHSWDGTHHLYFLGDGDRKTDGTVIPATYGDEIALYIKGLHLTIDGEWVIDFTQEKDGSK